MGKNTVSVDYKRCMACGVCVQACPFNCLVLEELIKNDIYKNAYPKLSKDNPCTGCGICRNACPLDCIKLN